MSGPVTVDTSVFVSEFTPSEPAHASSNSFLRYFMQHDRPIFLPTLAIVEIAATIGRRQDKPELGTAFVSEVGQFPQVTLIDLDTSLAQEAPDIAARHPLHGSDAVYAAGARRFATTLVTLGREQKDRAPAVLEVRHSRKAV